MAMKDQYLYLHMTEQLRRLNITSLIEKNSSTPPDFEIVHNYSSDDRLPFRMGCMLVDSKLYLVGGEKVPKECKFLCAVPPQPSYDVFVFDPTTTDHPEGPIRSCEEGTFPRLLGPKTNPIVVTIGEKIYALATAPFVGFLSNLKPPYFEVFDPVQRSWRSLPDPSVYKQGGEFTYFHFCWGNKLFVYNPLGLHFFDTQKEKWEDTTLTLPFSPNFSLVGPEFKGFVFAMPIHRFQLMAFQLDSDGFLKDSDKVIYELRDVFGPPYLVSFYGFINHLGDGRMCLLVAGLDEWSNWSVRVAVFRVFVSSHANHQDAVLSVVLETWQLYDDDDDKWLYIPDIKSTFVICEEVKKRAGEYITRDSISKKTKTTMLQ